jgi:hypothetical protein
MKKLLLLILLFVGCNSGINSKTLEQHQQDKSEATYRTVNYTKDIVGKTVKEVTYPNGNVVLITFEDGSMFSARSYKYSLNINEY